MAQRNLLAERFPALGSRDYRIFWAGQAISLAGSTMQGAAIDWHLYSLTGSALALGAIGLARLLPVVVFALIGGAAADSLDRRRILLVTQSLLSCVALVFGGLSAAGRISAAWIYGLAACSAALAAFDNPSRQAMIPNLVPREHLYSAIAINSVTFRFSRILGPLAAGVLIGVGRIEMVYFVNALSFVAAIAALLMIRAPFSSIDRAQRPDISLRSLREGLAFVWGTPILVWTMGLDFLATFFSSADALLPIFAQDILKVGPEGYGLLRAAGPTGTLVASAVLVLLPPILRQGRVILWAVALYGLFTVLFGVSTLYWFSWLCLAAVGAADTVSTVIRQNIRHMVTPDHLRGRMVSVNMVFFMGGPQLGELEAGVVAHWIGAPWSVITGGLGCLVVAAIVAGRAPALRGYRHDEALGKGPTGAVS